MDAPDWLGVPGSTRYLGVINAARNNVLTNTLAFSPSVTDGAVIVVPINAVQATENEVSVTVAENLTGAATGQSYRGIGNNNLLSPCVAPVARAMGVNWTIQVIDQRSGASTDPYYCFAMPYFPVSLITSNSDPLAVQIVYGPGQYPGSGLPVVPARASLSAVTQPASGVQATVTFPAVPGRQYMTDYIDVYMLAVLGAAIQNQAVYVRDGLTNAGAIIWTQGLSTPAGALSVTDREWHPNVSGTVGNAMTIEFDSGVANFSERVSAGVYF